MVTLPVIRIRVDCARNKRELRTPVFLYCHRQRTGRPRTAVIPLQEGRVASRRRIATIQTFWSSDRTGRQRTERSGSSDRSIRPSRSNVVVEMRLPNRGPQVGQPFQGRIKVLIDQDRDGYFETSHLFADSLVFPTGLQPFRDGVIVTLAGEVAYLADTDGDYRCDQIETWFTGFSKDNEQLRANHPTWTLENQIHVASGLRGGEIQSQQSQWTSLEKPVSLAARDFSFSPLGGQWHAVAGNSQYGYFPG